MQPWYLCKQQVQSQDHRGNDAQSSKTETKQLIGLRDILAFLFDF